jgi:hypothetical protein
VDDSLIAIVMVVMVVWEFIQRAIRQKTRGERAIERDARDKEAILASPSYEMQKVDCAFSPEDK